MRVLITGGTGSIGTATTARLVAKGWDVRVIGIDPDAPQIDGAEYHQCDILNYDDVLSRTRGCDAVIHLAAIRGPGLASGSNVFQVNVAGTFNVFEAAAVCGIKRIAQASSINAAGYFYGSVEPPTHYLPMDEDHPIYTTDAYSFSKQMIEEIGTYYWRRDGISSVAMRYPGVFGEGYIESENYLRKRATLRRVLDELVSLPEAEQQARIADVRQRTLAYRATRPLEYDPANQQVRHHARTQDDPLFWNYAYDRYNFWALIDDRDAALSLELGITAEYEGAHALFVNDSHNGLGYDSRTLARLFFPEIDPSQYTSDLAGTESLVSILKARALIGFAPEHSVASLGESE
ncbi:MAG: NAD(P)-dependent oxidoreductase [Chloroflexota bacterium]